MGDFPAYLTCRYGAKASKHARHGLGVRVGVGYRFCRFAPSFNVPSVVLEDVHSGQSAGLRPQRSYGDYSNKVLTKYKCI